LILIKDNKVGGGNIKNWASHAGSVFSRGKISIIKYFPSPGFMPGGKSQPLISQGIDSRK